MFRVFFNCLLHWIIRKGEDVVPDQEVEKRPEDKTEPDTIMTETPEATAEVKTEELEEEEEEDSDDVRKKTVYYCYSSLIQYRYKYI